LEVYNDAFKLEGGHRGRRVGSKDGGYWERGGGLFVGGSPMQMGSVRGGQIKENWGGYKSDEWSWKHFKESSPLVVREKKLHRRKEGPTGDAQLLEGAWKVDLAAEEKEWTWPKGTPMGGRREYPMEMGVSPAPDKGGE